MVIELRLAVLLVFAAVQTRSVGVQVPATVRQTKYVIVITSVTLLDWGMAKIAQQTTEEMWMPAVLLVFAAVFRISVAVPMIASVLAARYVMHLQMNVFSASIMDTVHTIYGNDATLLATHANLFAHLERLDMEILVSFAALLVVTNVEDQDAAEKKC